MARISFKTVRARAAKRKGGEAALAKLLLKPTPARALLKLTDDRALAEITRRVFCAGFVWRVIEAKWPGFEKAFLGFAPKRLLFQPDDFWEALTRDPGIVRNPRNIRAVRDNAKFVTDIAREHGSFGRFVATWPVDDQVGLLELLAKRGARLGGMTGQYLLRFLGRDGYVLSRDVVLCLRDAGVAIAAQPTSKKDLRAAQDQMNAWAAESGLPLAQVSRICALSVGENHPVAALLERGMDA